MRRNIILILALVISTVIIGQQRQQPTSNPKAIATLDQAASKISKSGYGMALKLTVKEPDSDKSITENIDFRVSGNKFYLKGSDMEIFFDGKTQWVYYDELNEVTISTPTSKELQEISPMAFIKGYKGNYRVDFDPNQTSQKEHIVIMLPNDKQNDLFRMRVFINKSTNEITTIESSFRNGTRMTLTVGAYKQLSGAAATFNFDAKKYPKISVNDLR